MNSGVTKRQLYLAVYGPGPAWIPGQPTSAQPLREHGRYILDLHGRGQLRLAGPFPNDPGGAVLFEAEDEASASAIVDADPAVTSGIMVCTLRRWEPLDWTEIAGRA